MQWKIDQGILSKAADDIRADLGSLDDLPEELANTVANIYYRLHAYQEHLVSGRQSLLSPYLHQSKNWIDSFKDFNEFSAEAIAIYNAIPKVIKTLRDACITKPSSKEYLVGYLIDTYKFRIPDAQNKSGIRRWLERQFKASWVIDDLYTSIKRLPSATSTSPTPKQQSSHKVTRKKTAISDLHWSAAGGDREKTIQLLQSGLQPNLQMSLDDKSIQLCDGATPLHLACANGIVPIVEELLRAGANPNMTTGIGDTPLHWALDVSDELVDELLKSRANHLQTMKGGEIALHWACCPNPVARWGNGYGGPVVGYLSNDPLRTIQILLDAGSPINQPDNYGWTPLHWRTQLIGGPKGIIEVLLNHGADLFAKNNKNQTPLIQAIMSINPLVVEELLDNNATIPDNFETKSLITHFGSKHKTTLRDQLIELLIHRKILSNEQDDVKELLKVVDTGVGFTSIERDRPAKLDAAPNIEILRLLLAHGANINSGNSDGVTPLMVAAGAGNSALKTGLAFTDIFYRNQ